MNYLRKIFSPSFLVFSLMLLIYTIYRSEILYGGDKRNYYFFYYVVTIFLIIFSIISFFIKNVLKDYLIIFLFSFAIAAYSFEGYLIYKLNKKYQNYEKHSGKKWDKRTRFEIYNDLKKIDSQVVVSVRGQLHENEDYPFYSLSGASNSKTVGCNENGYYWIYNSDRYGFNNPDEEWDKEEIEYLLVGDSFTHGSCVNRPHDIASVLRNLSNKSVLNLGYAGNGPLIEYATLKEYLTPNVKKVLWIYSPNDFYNLTNEKKEKILKKYFSDISFIQNLKLKQDLINKNIKISIKKKEKEIKKKHLRNGKNQEIKMFIKLYNLRILFFGKKQEVTAAPLKDYKKVLQQTLEITKKNNSKLYVIILPGYSQYVKVRNKSSIIKNYKSIKGIVSELNIPFIDIHKKVFEKEKNPLELFPFEINGHYNIEGYKKVAKEIYYLTNN